MGKETKIGLGVIAALLVVFAVVLTLRLTNSSEEAVAAADATEKESEKAKPGPTPKSSPSKLKTPKPLLPPPQTNAKKTASSLKITIPTAPVPDANTKPRSSAGWATAGNGQRRSQQISRTQLGGLSNYGSAGFVLDPPSTQQSNGLSANRYARRQQTAAGSRYQSRQVQSNYKNVSTNGGMAPYNRGNYHQNYSRQQSYGSQPGYGGQSTYGGQRTITPPPSITPRQPTAGPRADGTYEVQPNDSYWLISKQLYGSGAYFKALAEHNLREHPMPDNLRVGDSISAPSLVELVDYFPDLCPSPERQKTLAKRSNVIAVSAQYGGGSSYTVAEGDTLYDIARYELGDASRWVEIHELNRNVLQGDFDFLVPGMTLVMPQGATDSLTTRQGSTDSVTRRPARYQTPAGNTLRR